MDNITILMQMVEDYKRLPEVEAIVLGGSSAAKSDDNHSDYDVYIYCNKKEPDVEKRRQIALKYSDNPEIDNHYFETGDVYYLRETGKPIDIMYRSTDWIEDSIKRVWQEGNASLGYTTCFVDNVNKSQILYDKSGWFNCIQKLTQTPYPKKLADNIIDKNLSFMKGVMFSYYDQLNSAVKRNDYVSVNHRSAAFLASYFDVIFAHNRVMNPGEKRLVEFALKNCKELPKDFEKDVESMSAGPVECRVETAEKMVGNLKEMLNQ